MQLREKWEAKAGCPGGWRAAGTESEDPLIMGATALCKL